MGDSLKKCSRCKPGGPSCDHCGHKCAFAAGICHHCGKDTSWNDQ